MASEDLWGQIGDLPPVHWLTHLGLWHHAPFTWIGELLHFIFTQQALRWTEARFALIVIIVPLLILMGLELLFWMWSWVRGRQIDYNKEKAEFWTTGPRAGKRKAKPIKLDRARARSFAWPQVGLPLYLVAVAMFTWLIMWPGEASRVFLAFLWFALTPVRRTMAISAARKAYRANHPNDTINSTLLQDVTGYFRTGVSRPARVRREIEPPFENTKWLYRILNWGHAKFGRYGTFWRVFRFWNFVRFWGFLVQLIVAFAWPISAVIAPFYYMDAVEDYEDMMTPWWRAYDENRWESTITRDAAANSGADPA